MDTLSCVLRSFRKLLKQKFGVLIRDFYYVLVVQLIMFIIDIGFK